MIRVGNQTARSAATPRQPFDFAIANGFDAFEWFPDKQSGGGWDAGDLDGAQRRTIQETAKARGMRLSVHARWQANPLRPEALVLIEEDIELARDLGAVLLNIHLFEDRGIAAYAEGIGPLIRRLREAGLQLSIENTPQHSPEDFNTLFALLHQDDARAVKHVGMCFDLGHANLCAVTRNDYLGFWDKLAPEIPIIHLHMHENYGDADSHLPLFTGPAGRDESGIRGIVERLRRRHFSGSIIFEQWPQPPALLNQARDKLMGLLGIAPVEPANSRADLNSQASVPASGSKSPAVSGQVPASPVQASMLGDFGTKLVEGDRRSRSWREKLDSVRDILANEPSLGAEQLVDVAVYLRFLGAGHIRCAEDGRHFRPAHHAQIALQIRERLATLHTPDLAFIVRAIHPWLPSSALEFQRAEPLTRIRDIAHRNDIPSELKREIKVNLQNKLHRCAGPEDLATSSALLERVSAPGAGYAPEFVQQFRIFHGELKEFFSASSLDERLLSLLPALNEPVAKITRRFLDEKSRATPAAQIAAFNSLTELRRRLVAESRQSPDLKKQELLLADIALEKFAFALLSDIANGLGATQENPSAASSGSAPTIPPHDATPFQTWECWLGVFQQTIANLELSQVEPEECHALAAELQTWRPLDPADRDQLLRLAATVSRARRLAESYSDRIMAWFPPRALALGRALDVPAAAIQVFGEAEIRGHLIFQLSKLASSLLGRLRQALNQPAWDVVVSGNATGRVTPATQLGGNYSEPALVLLNKADGDEEIPAGVAGVVLAQELPHLSHLAVRARQAGIVMVVCGEPARLDELKQCAGKTLTLSASADKVAWQPSSGAHALPARRSEVRVPQARLLPEPGCIPLERAVPEYAGNKADGVRRLAQIANGLGDKGRPSGSPRPSPLDAPDGLFKNPPSLVVPFGAMTEAFRAAPAIEAEYKSCVGALNTESGDGPAAARLRELIQHLPVPGKVLADVAAQFNHDAPLMVRSSANDEDLENFAAAGLYESVANVPLAGVAAAIRSVWASLWTRRAILSRQQAGIPHTQAHVAVLIQLMLVPDFSFILHTVNPINGHRVEAYAEIVPGLGETLASAAMSGNPYRLVCDKQSGAVTMLAFASFSHAFWPGPAGGLQRKIVDYSKIPLSLDAHARQNLARRLAGIARRVEEAFQQPQDIEGAVVGDEIFLVQSRHQQGLEE